MISLSIIISSLERGSSEPVSSRFTFVCPLTVILRISAAAEGMSSAFLNECNAFTTSSVSFKDKFDLVNWIFSTEVTAIISDIVDVTHWADGLTALCGYMQQNRGFYINALRAEGQNSFSECLMDFYQELIKSMLAEVNLELQLSSFEQEVIARFYAHAMVGIILDWARDGMKIEPNPVIGIITELINGNMFQRAVSIKNNRETPAGSV